METVKKPIVEIIYEGTNITTDIKPYIISVTYTDYEQGQSDELLIKLDDKDAKWQSVWYPQKGDKIQAKMGYAGNLLDCGLFEVDEVDYDIPPDVITIAALATNITKSLREKQTIAYENRTLVDIAKEIGQRQGFTVIGTEGFVKIGRVTQKLQHDLTFLTKLAHQYGYVFKIANNKLVFYKIESLESVNSILILNKEELTSANLKDKTSETYSACRVSYYNNKDKKLHTAFVKGDKGLKNDTLKITERCENKEQAVLKAQAALKNKNCKAVEGTITFPGKINAIAGVNVELKKINRFSGKYHITQSTHTVSRENYSTSAEVRKLA